MSIKKRKPGRPPLIPYTIRVQGERDKAKYRDLVSRCMNATEGQLKTIKNDPEETALARSVAGAFINGISAGIPPNALCEINTGKLVDDLRPHEKDLITKLRALDVEVTYKQILNSAQLTGPTTPTEPAEDTE